MTAQRPSDTKAPTPELRAAQLAQYCQHLPAALASSFALALIYAMTLWSIGSKPVVVLWLALSLAIAGARGYLWKLHRREDAEDADAVLSYLRPFRITSLAAGLVWGSATVALYSAADASSQLVLVFALAGITAAAAKQGASLRG